MGGSHSCWRSGGSDEKTVTVKGNRPNDYMEIDDDHFLTSETPKILENGGVAKADDDVEEMYENCSSIIRASNIEVREAGDKPRVKPTSGGGASAQPLADVMKHSVTPTTNGKKAKKAKKPKPQLMPRAEKAQEMDAAKGSGEPRDQATAFCLGNPSEVGHYQNVQPVALQKAKPLPQAVQQEPEEGGDVYAKVEKPKPKPKILNGNSQQLNYVEVEFSQSPSHENKVVINSKNEQPPITYTDVIHKDGKIMLVSPSS